MPLMRGRDEVIKERISHTQLALFLALKKAIRKLKMVNGVKQGQLLLMLRVNMEKLL